MATYYGFSGRLAGSGCYHMVTVTRDEARKMLRRYRPRRTGNRTFDCPGSREWVLPIRSCARIAKGYQYDEVTVYAGRAS